MAKVEPAHQININSTEIDDLVTKTMFGDRKSSAWSSADNFFEKDKTCPRWFLQSIFFYFIHKYG